MEKKTSDLPIVDKHIDNVFTKDSNKILKELLHLFIQETPQLQAEINLAFKRKQPKTIANLLHKLLGSCAYCGWLRLKISILMLENAIAQGKYSHELLEQFNTDVQDTLNKAEEIIESQ